MARQHQRVPRAEFPLETVRLEIGPAVDAQLMRHGDLGVDVSRLDVQLEVDGRGGLAGGLAEQTIPSRQVSYFECLTTW